MQLEHDTTNRPLRGAEKSRMHVPQGLVGDRRWRVGWTLGASRGDHRAGIVQGVVVPIFEDVNCIQRDTRSTLR